MSKKIIKKVLRDTLPILGAYLVLGMGFGVLLMPRGYGVGTSVAMSTVIYAGSMQFLAIDMIGAGASLASIALTTFMVNARHFFFGISMVDAYKNTGFFKPYLIYGLTDETYSLVCSVSELTWRERKSYYFLVTFLDQIYWVGSCALGSVLGGLISFSTEGVDFALTALFLTVFVEQWLSTDEHRFGLTGLLCSILCLVIFGEDSFLIPSMILIVAALSLMQKKGDTK